MDNGGARLIEHTERIKHALADLCEPLHDVFTQAGTHPLSKAPAEEDRDNNPDFSGRDYAWFRTHFVRAFAHNRLQQRTLDPWRLTGDHWRNGELWMANGEFELRFLHGLSEADVPAPGSNRARAAYYCNPPLPMMPALFGSEIDKLILLWRLNPLGEPSFRVVRTIGRWKFGGTAKLDVDFPLPQSSEELINMTFTPSDDGIDLNLPNEENDEFGAGGISG
ncbi:hypothetical protein [Nocardiopsis sp. JB363]|uniref:hypothetical protein n=1 Tax=Nocardiopsis sp. JB363 TaxID=1434837 RepID=UPI00097A29A4|nr:hypothetical protein [Nocardiopsis sp. JB363]SIO89862.1 hypothetical protein BQ8420_23765 [Nocardiopsis sp. JB363]